MRKRIIIIFVVLAVLAGVTGAVVYGLREPPEPMYEGKLLSEWLIAVRPENGYSETDFMRSAAAMKKFGTNAVPTLFRMLRANDSGLRYKLNQLLRKLHLVRQPFVPAAARNRAAGLAFGQLRWLGKPYVPELIKIYSEKISPGSQLGVLTALDNIGPIASEAAPALIAGLANTNQSVRAETIDTLGYIWTKPALAVLALTNMLVDPYARPRARAAHVLAGYRDRAKSALPALLMALNDGDAQVRQEAQFAISNIDVQTYRSIVTGGQITNSTASK